VTKFKQAAVVLAHEYKFPVYSQLTRITERQTDRQTDKRTDGKAISIAERLLYVTLANNEKLTDTYNKRTLDYAGLFLPYHAEGVRV